jgi:hypothetical protein
VKSDANGLFMVAVRFPENFLDEFTLLPYIFDKKFSCEYFLNFFLALMLDG